MRRREKFVIASSFLSLALFAVQYVPLEFRYLAVGVFSLITYLVSIWVLSDDLQRYELVTVLPFPALYSAAVGLFYFLLPTHFLSRAFILGLFGIGMYALYLTSNIFSVAKGRTIQLLHAAHAIGLFFTLVTSILFLNTIFSLRLHFWFNALLVGLTHFPLILLSLWSINLQPRVERNLLALSSILTIVLAEAAAIFSFYPMSVWHISLFIMSFLYIGLGIFHSYLKGRLFTNTIGEYSMLAIFVGVTFVLLFPGK